MEYQEFIEKRRILQKIIDDLKLEYVYSKTSLRVGDTVKFIKQGDSVGEKDTKRVEKIYDFDVYPTTDMIYAKCGHYTIRVTDCKKVRSS